MEKLVAKALIEYLEFGITMCDVNYLESVIIVYLKIWSLPGISSYLYLQGLYLIVLVHGFTSRESIPLFIDSFLLVHNFSISFPVFCCLYMYLKEENKSKSI